MSEEVVQIWVRTEKGKVFGPLTPTTVELLLDNGIIDGRVQVSLDGSNYVFPGRMPGIRMVFPKTLWGEQVLPPNELDEAWAKVTAPPPLPTAGKAAPGGAAPPGGPVGVPGGPVGVPGGPVGVPGGPVPRAGPMAGPGARAQPQARPMNPAGQQRRPAAPAGGGTLADSLFGDLPQAPVSSPSGIRAAPQAAPKGPAMSASAIAAAMGNAPPPVSSSPSSVAAAPAAAHAAPPAAHPSPSSASDVAAPPSSPAVAALEKVPPSGSLREVSPMRLYFLAAAQDLTGLLTFQLPDRAILMHFRKGSPDLVDSTHPEDALATWLLRQRLVGPEQLGQAQKEGARFGGELLPALFGLGLLNPNAAIDALNQRVAGLIGQALRATDGSFTFQPVDLPPQKAMPAGNRWQLYCEQVRKISTVELKARLHGALDFPVMKASGPVPVTELRLSPQETRAFSGFDGTRTLNQLLQSGAPEAEHAVRVAFMLEPCDLVSFAGTVVKTAAPPRPVAPAPPPPAPVAAPAGPPGRPVITPQGSAPVITPAAPTSPVVPPAPVAVAPAAPPPVPRPPGVPGNPVPGNPVQVKPPSYPGGPGPVVSPARPSSPGAASSTAAAPAPAHAAAPSLSPAQYDAEVKRLSDVLAKMKGQNHFEVLSLTKDSPANAVKIAYFKLAKDYHPDTVPPGAPAALSKVKADIFARIGEANRTLSDENLRKDYLAELEHGGTGEKVDVSKLLQAEEFFQKGKILVNARKFPEAVKMLDDAIALTPDDAEAYAWRGYARFYTFPDKKVGLAEAMKDIQNCLKRNPNIVPAHYFQGMMNKVLGDLAAAKKHFNATVKLDPKHIDAQRELRMMK
jgi:hypothetical protein